MPIKKSQLEQKWYFRIAKVVFTALPFVVIAYLFYKSNFPFGTLTQKAVIGYFASHTNGVVLVILGTVAYFVCLNIIWRVFLYMVFGGLVNDTIKAPTVNAAAQTKPGLSENDQKEIGSYVFLLILIILIYLIYNYQSGTSNASKNVRNVKYDGGGRTTCVSTGCGPYWRCDGTYYIGNQQVNVHGCLPRKAGEIYSGWTGTCRQCP